MPDELELVRKAAEGDDSAFEQLVNQYQKPVYNLAYRMCGNADDAFDLSQEAFLNAWKGLKGFQFQSSFSTWLYRLTSNVCLSYLRSKKRKSAVSLVFLDEEEEEQEWSIPDSAPSPEEQAISREQHRDSHNLPGVMHSQTQHRFVPTRSQHLSHIQDPMAQHSGQ